MEKKNEGNIALQPITGVISVWRRALRGILSLGDNWSYQWMEEDSEGNIVPVMITGVISGWRRTMREILSLDDKWSSSLTPGVTSRLGCTMRGIISLG